MKPPKISSYTRNAAHIIADILIDCPQRMIPRAVILERWLDRYPQLDRTHRRTEQAHKRLRRRSYLGQKTSHRGYSTGRVGRLRLNESLRRLELLGVLERYPETVRVVNVPLLVRLRDGEP